MSDISREAVKEACSELHWQSALYRAQNGSTQLTANDKHAAMLLALRAALDAAEATIAALCAANTDWQGDVVSLRAALDRAEADKAAAVEACAKIVDRRREKVLAALAKAPFQSMQFYSLRSKEEALEKIAAAIRQGGGE